MNFRKAKCSLILLLLLFHINGLTQAYKIKLTIKDAHKLKAQLAYYQGDNKLVKQNAEFDKNGKVVFQGEEKLPPGIYFIVLGDIGYFDFLIRSEQDFSMQTDTLNFIKHMKVKNSKENELFFNYQEKVVDIKVQMAAYDSVLTKLKKTNDSISIVKDKIAKLGEELNSLVDKTRKKHPNSYLTKILTAMSFTDVDQFNFADEELLRTPFYHNMLRLFIKKSIEKNTDYIKHQVSGLIESVKVAPQNYQYVSSYLLNFYNTFYKNGMNEVFVHIADSYFLPNKAAWLSKTNLENVKKRRDYLAQSLPGMPAKDLTLKSNTGEYYSLHQMEGNITLLYFWSVDCGHCTEATKILKLNYQSLSDKGVQILALNIDKKEKDWLKKIEEDDLPWLNCIDTDESSEYREKYYVYGSPLLYVIDSKHNIIARKNGEQEIKLLVEQLIK